MQSHLFPGRFYLGSRRGGARAHLPLNKTLPRQSRLVFKTSLSKETAEVTEGDLLMVPGDSTLAQLAPRTPRAHPEPLDYTATPVLSDEEATGTEGTGEQHGPGDTHSSHRNHTYYQSPNFC